MCACLVATWCLTACMQPTGLLGPWDSPAKNTGMGCHSLLLQGVFPTQGLNPCTLQVSCTASGFLTTEPLGKHLGNLQLIWEKGPCPSLLYSLSIATSFIPRFQSSKYQLSILLQNSFCGLRCLIFTQANIKDEGISLHTILCYSYKG